MDLTKNTVFITGGSSGIGLSIAKAFSDLQNTVIVCARNQEKLESVKNKYPDIHTIRCDITKKDEVQMALEEIETRFSSLNILINNAGLQYNYDFYEDENAVEKIDAEINLNLLAQIRLTKIFLPVLMKQSKAAVINVTSALAIVPKESAPVYCATKAAMHSFSKSLRFQLEKTQVKVFEVLPPLVDTDMTKGRGKGKISPDHLAAEVINGLKKDTYEIRVGKVKILFLINRLLPALAEKLIRGG